MDNLDVKVDMEVGERSIHATHLMAFQNVDESKVQKTTRNSIPKPKNQKIFIEDINIGSISVDRKKNLPTNFCERSDLCGNSFFNKRFLLWSILRYQSSCDQHVPIFKGCNLQQSGLSIQAQDNYLIMTAADQRGEQTINRDAKTLGNFTFFTLKMNSPNQIDWTQNLL